MGDELDALLLSRRLDDDDINVVLGDDKDHDREHDFISSLLDHGDGAGASYPNPVEHGDDAGAGAAGGLIDTDAQVWAKGGEGGGEDVKGEKTAKGAKGGEDGSDGDLGQSGNPESSAYVPHNSRQSPHYMWGAGSGGALGASNGNGGKDGRARKARGRWCKEGDCHARPRKESWGGKTLRACGCRRRGHWKHPLSKKEVDCQVTGERPCGVALGAHGVSVKEIRQRHALEGGAEGGVKVVKEASTAFVNRERGRRGNAGGSGDGGEGESGGEDGGAFGERRDAQCYTARAGDITPEGNSPGHGGVPELNAEEGLASPGDPPLLQPPRPTG